MIVARRGHAYPQVGVTAADLVNARVARIGANEAVASALTHAVTHDVPALTLESHDDVAVLREDLQRAVRLGLGAWPAARLVRPLPFVGPDESEVAVRRHLAAGAAAVIVRGGAERLGAVMARAAAVAGSSMTRTFARALDDDVRGTLLRIGALAEIAGERAFAVGGLVRDAVQGGAPGRGRDVDVVVEGDGLSLARLLAAERGGTLVEHARFLTASITEPSGRRIDIATARSERYEAPGALPRVMPAGIDQDLRRRDFTVNAMAVDLASGVFALIDPLGGRVDLTRRRLRILHPLSFVEDPTRIFRAARYAARLGLRADAGTVTGQALALDLVPYAALSGPRLVAELRRLLVEERAEEALIALGRTGAFRLFDPRYSFGAATAHRLRGLATTLRWAAARGMAASGVDLLLLALLAEQPADIAARCLARLEVTGEPRARLERILAGARAVALRAARTRSAAARALRGAGPAELAWLWLEGDAPTRRLVERGVEGDLSVGPWLSGDDLAALGVRGPAVARLLDELRDGRLDETIADRPAALAHVRRRAVALGGPRTTSPPDDREG